MGLLFMIFVAFFVLKIVGVIAWSWWLVTLPLWILPAVWGLYVMLGLLFIVATALVVSVFFGLARLFSR